VSSHDSRLYSRRRSDIRLERPRRIVHVDDVEVQEAGRRDRIGRLSGIMKGGSESGGRRQSLTCTGGAVRLDASHGTAEPQQRCVHGLNARFVAVPTYRRSQKAATAAGAWSPGADAAWKQRMCQRQEVQGAPTLKRAPVGDPRATM